MGIDLLILGLEGVLFDTAEAHHAAWASAFKTCGVDGQRPMQQSGEGRPSAEPATRSEKRIDSHEAGLLQQTKSRHFRDWIASNEVRVNPRAAQLIEHALAQGCKLAVATDMSSYEAGLLLERKFGNAVHDVFSVIATEADFSAPAENGPYRLIQRTLGMDFRNCAVIDATDAGINAAVRAGLRTLPMASEAEADIWSLDEEAADEANRRATRASGKAGAQPGFNFLNFSSQPTVSQVNAPANCISR